MSGSMASSYSRKNNKFVINQLRIYPNNMNRLFVFLLACVIAQFSYGQNELSIKEMEDSMAHGNLYIQVDLAKEYVRGERVEQDLAKA